MEKINLLILLADDMGYSDIGCYDSEIATPNLDRLAKNGLRFSQLYNTGRCYPSRSSLLTGLYSHEAGVGHMPVPVLGRQVVAAPFPHPAPCILHPAVSSGFTCENLLPAVE